MKKSNVTKDFTYYKLRHELLIRQRNNFKKMYYDTIQLILQERAEHYNLISNLQKRIFDLDKQITFWMKDSEFWCKNSENWFKRFKEVAGNKISSPLTAVRSTEKPIDRMSDEEINRLIDDKLIKWD